MKEPLQLFQEAVALLTRGSYEEAQALLSSPDQFGDGGAFAEALGMLGVKLEAREFSLQQKIDELKRARRKLARENTSLKARLRSAQGILPLSESPALQGVMRVVERVAPTDATVLIGGESGTGKEVLARTMHDRSTRTEGPFVAINCAALPESLLEAELFGVEKGVATGVSARKGKIEAAHGGTLFLDEIGDMELGTQARMLRAIQEREVVRVGSSKPRKVDFRLLAASHKDLPGLIREGAFREDLYYRLCVVVLEMPPLRARPEDVLPLARFFLSSFGDRYGREMRGFTPEAERRLVGHRWPGNIRELRNALERAILMADGDRVDVDDLQILESSGRSGADTASPGVRSPAPPDHPDPARESPSGPGMPHLDPEAEKQAILDALARFHGSRKHTAAHLGIHRETLRLKMKRYRIVWKARRGRQPAWAKDSD